ncbi:MAG: hypothetical protein U9N56_02005 [Actinomycetota bacterium]|nr:hypothetical protein [Actinomycetota bacterium]
MSEVPTLRVVPLEHIRRHEEIDPMRVERLMGRIAADGVQVNPMVCSEAPGGELVLLDGATRTAALKGLGLEHAVVQIVEPTHFELETWHHVVRDCPVERLLQRIRTEERISLTAVSGPPLVHLVDDSRFSVVSDKISANAALAALVKTYIGSWTVSRVTDPSTDSVAWRFPDWSMIVEFPTLTAQDVLTAAVEEDLLPAGITRFIVDGRALRLNVDLSMLEASVTQEEKQASLERILEDRAHDGRIRRYEETVFILDD